MTGAGFPEWAYHGYWADDLLSLDPRFGTGADFRALVSACHGRGIRVLLDVVYNHAGYESKYTKDPKTKGWFRTNERGDCGSDDITSCVAGLPDLRTEDPEVAKYLLDAQIAWARRLGAARAEQGWGMLVEQAAEAFELWRGVRPDTAPVLEALRKRAETAPGTRS